MPNAFAISLAMITAALVGGVYIGGTALTPLQTVAYFGALVLGVALVLRFFEWAAAGGKLPPMINITPVPAGPGTPQVQPPTNPALPAPVPAPPPPPPKSDFDTCIAYTLQWEGGNDDDPRDPGGRTSRGIIQTEWNTWRQTHPGLPSDVWQAPQDQVLAIYKQQYWDALSCDELPAGIDFVVFDYGVNSGISRAANLLQQMTGADVDGEVGPDTIAATAKVTDVAGFINKFCDARLAFLKGLGTWGTFGKGWTNRVEGVRQEALGLVGAAPSQLGTIVPSNPTTIPAHITWARQQVGKQWSSGSPPSWMQDWIAKIKIVGALISGLTAYCDQLLNQGYWSWCGGFVAAALAQAGKPPVFTSAQDIDRFAWAPAWAQYGTKVDVANGEQPQTGDIVVYQWNGGGEHVTFYNMRNEDTDTWQCIGGNQGSNHVVSIEELPQYPDKQVFAVRRPSA